MKDIVSYTHPTEGTQQPDPQPGFYYVTVRRCNNNAGIGAEHRMLRGPFVNDHAAALAAVDDARKLACELDARGHWYAYGTARSETDLGPGMLDKRDQQLKAEVEAAKPHKFWDLYEQELCASVTKKPDEYALSPGETPTAYARRIRAKFQDAGVANVIHNTPTFKRVAKRLGIKPTRAELIRASTATEESPPCAA